MVYNKKLDAIAATTHVITEHFLHANAIATIPPMIPICGFALSIVKIPGKIKADIAV